ncbi:hypothetical protein LT493_41165 [Streptomyces tricolor]|nr:hypothetical protein [Streptomyces tricolor]
MLAALGVRPGRPRAERERPRLADDPRVRAALDGRRSSLAPFWLRMQERSEVLTGHALVVDGEDTFTAMLAHVLRSNGLDVTVRRYDEPGLRGGGAGARGDGRPGPAPVTPPTSATPRCGSCGTSPPRRSGRTGTGCSASVSARADRGGAGPGDRPQGRAHQGAQTEIDLFGRPETVGFYNSFVARCDEEAAQ